MKKLLESFLWKLLLFLVISVTGCAAPKPVVVFQPRGSREHISRTAVLPFENISETLDADRRITSLFLTKLYNAAIVEIIEEGEVETYLRANRIRRTGEIDAKNAAKICEKLNIQAVILGNVGEYTFVTGPNGRIPVVGVTVRIVDRAGNIILAVTHVREGDDTETLFGFGRYTSAIKLSDVLVQDIVEKVVEFIEFYNSSSEPAREPAVEPPPVIPDKPEVVAKGPKPEEKIQPPPTEPEVKPPEVQPEPDAIPDKLSEEDLKKLKETAKKNALRTWDRIMKSYKRGGGK